ncbi:unnamed protein product [Lepeophtheirus salmonis]|uniref:Novel acetylcholine receptor chaperone n=1 Tax=Lepeophtheirus salmonis TaxID=72036 RepID=A0A7R8CP15_LEPSM|nr:unnamed protein product [Lepeophtheirus salmonis]CAF2881514.1 unnamed protein product [Lepeophtheirus salmonis]
MCAKAKDYLIQEYKGFSMIPVGRKALPGSGKDEKGTWAFIKTLYSNEYRWSVVKKVKLPSKWYRRTVGGLEILCGIIMCAVPHRKCKNVANILLLGFKTLNVYSHWAINDAFERTAPSLVFFLMLCCRLVVDWQLSKKKEKDPLISASTPSATKKDQ